MNPHLEKRRYPRNPCSGKIYLSRLADQRSEEMPLYVREMGQGGMSGTYFGKDMSKGDEFIVRHNGYDSKRAKLVWTHETIETVYMLGFCFQN